MPHAVHTPATPHGNSGSPPPVPPSGAVLPAPLGTERATRRWHWVHAPTSHTAFLRLHIDLQRVAGAMCRRRPVA
ncbi:putative leader peptide [Streptomyces liangshanensis]|uniref:putative leader peptide n=1 Tax=Streptomyces liangshanensis TaxID=2717324 RepID=UPI003C7E020D